MFLLMLCRKKNPNILNIAGHAFLEDCGIEGVTIPARGRSTSIRTFRDALGFDSFRIAGFANGPHVPSDSTDQPSAQSPHLPAHIAAQPTDQPAAGLTK
jgi:hypothetical protein